MKPTLNAEDIKIIRRMIRHEFKNALFRTIEVEKAARPGEDAPREGRVHEKVETNVLDWFVSYLPYIEGALRGMQEDVNKTNNSLNGDFLAAIEAMKNILLNHEEDILTIGKFSKQAKLLLEGTDIKRIEN